MRVISSVIMMNALTGDAIAESRVQSLSYGELTVEAKNGAGCVLQLVTTIILAAYASFPASKSIFSRCSTPHQSTYTFTKASSLLKAFCHSLESASAPMTT